MIYLLMFILSSLIIAWAENDKGTKKTILLIIGLCLPIIMAFIRADNIGIDINTYIKPLYNCVLESEDYFSYLDNVKRDDSTRDLEIGFISIGYFVASSFKSINALFFVYEAIIIVFIYLAVKLYNNNIKNIINGVRIPLWLSMFIFYCCFYNMSLTMIRQSTAVAISLFAIMLYLSNRKIAAYICCVFAVSIHSTSLFILNFVILFCVIKNKIIIMQIGYLILIFLNALYTEYMYYFLMKLVSCIFPVSMRYLVPSYMEFSGRDINVAWLYIILVSLFLATMMLYSDRRNIIRKFFFFIMLTAFLLIPLSIISANAGRILYYYMYFTVIIIPISYTCIKENDYKNLILFRLSVIFYCLLYWTCTIYLNDNTGTLNYQFVSL